VKWIKKGLIYKPSGEKLYSKSHAQVPVADFEPQTNSFKIYFSTRDEKGRSHPDWIRVDADNPSKIIAKAQKPILSLGALGTFDDCGVMPSWIVNHDDTKYLYYIGWNVRNTIPYHNAVGLAVSQDGGETFERLSEGPLWDRSHKDPHYSGSSCVLIDDNGVWKNWYLSCTEWREINCRAEPRYHLKYAESLDGINWRRNGHIAIDYKNDLEAGIVKASVFKHSGLYKMLFAYRNFTNYRTDTDNSYRIGYAESENGIDWNRQDQLAGITVSNEGWDSFMVTYPHVVAYRDGLYLFYNGNGFGESGFGYAVLDADPSG